MNRDQHWLVDRVLIVVAALSLIVIVATCQGCGGGGDETVTCDPPSVLVRGECKLAVMES